MSPPVAQTHPAEVVFTVEALHVIAPAVLLNTDIAFGTVLNKIIALNIASSLLLMLSPTLVLAEM